MFCGKCGNQINKGDGFCVHCGASAAKEKQSYETHESVCITPTQKTAKNEHSEKIKPESPKPKKTRKKTWIMIVAAAVVLAVAGLVLGLTLGSVDTALLDEPLFPLGCNPAGGPYVEYDGWIYFSNYEGIYKTSDGTDAIQIYSGYVDGSINIVDGWVYFIGGSGVYKMRTDGGRLQEIKDVKDKDSRSISTHYMIVAGDWIYYFEDQDGGLLCRIRTDGTHQARVTSINRPGIDFNFTLDEGWIYYKHKEKIYRMRPDGSKRTQIDFYIGLINKIIDGWYYDWFTRISLDSGTEEIISCNANDGVFTFFPLISDGWIYYEKSVFEPEWHGCIYKIRVDGTEETLITTSDNFGSIGITAVAGDWVFYTADGTPYMIRTDGSDKKEFDPDNLESVN